MRLYEFVNTGSPPDPESEYKRTDPALDWLDQTGKSRKPKFTLRHINKLRKMREAHKLEMSDREKYWQVMYGAPSPEAAEEMPLI